MKYGRGKNNNLPYLSLALYLMIYNICAKLFLFRMLLSYNLKGLMSHNLNSLSIVTPLPISRHISRTGANRHAPENVSRFLLFVRQQTIIGPF